jgi:DHA1 family bicyclomycin/chloramphenicol resistance-like MFS transporter
LNNPINKGLLYGAGSYITLYFHWQGNFIALLLGGLITFVMTVIFIPARKPSGQKQDFSLKGYISIFRSKPLLLLIVNFVLMFLPYWVFVGMLPLLYMKDLRVSLAHFGYYQGVLALASGLGSPKPDAPSQGKNNSNYSGCTPCVLRTWSATCRLLL